MRSPYTASSDRLADVIAAIQAMGTYRFYKLSIDKWSDRIRADSSQVEHWRRVFEEHPEFFRIDASGQKASLVLRRQQPKRFDVDSMSLITKAEFSRLTTEELARVSRSPLSSEEISTLIHTAISLHARALEQERNQRWWLPVLTAIISVAGVLLSVLVGSWISA